MAKNNSVPLLKSFIAKYKANLDIKLKWIAPSHVTYSTTNAIRLLEVFIMF